MSQAVIVSSERIFYVFPGQGSQYRGMGSDLVAEFPVAAKVYAQAGEILGFDMNELSFRDPDDQLDLTRFTQPALLTHEFACLEVFRELGGAATKPAIVAGHSLGEYTALVAAGALSFADALQLVAERGRLMSELGRGSMLATTLDRDNAVALADKHYCGIAACNLPEQTVIAGDDADLERLAADLNTSHPGKRAIPLKTEGAFHTYLMIGAAERFRSNLEATEFGALAAPTCSNYTGELHVDDATAIRSRLFFQLFNPVQWLASLSLAFEMGVDTIIEFGGGIGKGDTPAEKRPNLESLVKKSLKWREHTAQYAAAINCTGIRAAAELSNH
jgi:[acyl-carrier-protein] S-malonyltransferase